MANDNIGKFLSLLRGRDKYLYKILGKDSASGRDAWWIVRVMPAKAGIFSAIMAKGNCNLADYGEILESGFGTAIPPTILAKHGFDPGPR